MRYLLSVIAALGLAMSGEAATAAEHTTDTLEQVKQAVTDGTAVLIDVRETGEWKAGHLQDAMLLPLSKLKREKDSPELAKELSEKLAKGKVVYCHCRSGGRVLPASEILMRLGYDVRPLKAGYADLLKAGFNKADSNPDGNRVAEPVEPPAQ